MGRYLLDLHMTNVNKVAREALELAKPLAEERGVAVDVDLDPAIPDHHMDPGKLRQSILHFLRNAIRLSPAKGRVRLATALEEQGIRVEVQDSGPSIATDACATVFDIESIGGQHEKRCGDGMGFGLHLTRRFVELHGGQVGAGPTPSGGATFWFVLPRGEGLTKMIGDDAFAEDLAQKQA
jgi:signal transduction histidine kinase